ncbi:MAG: hypothetical protein IM638_19925 [Bacteroidetes bacterium]|nr:hypothetical protein [Bacteroidota bacterium]
MKKTLFILLGAMSTLVMSAQQNLTYDYEVPEFQEKGEIITANGDTVRGTIKFSVNWHRYVYIWTGKFEGKGKKYTPGQVKSIYLSLSNRFFEADIPVGETDGKDSTFYELTNRGNTKMKIYAWFSSPGVMVGGKLQGSTSYHVKMVGKPGVYSLSDKVMRPFNEKMAELVADCPELSLKIKNGEKGYKIPTLTNNDFRKQVLDKIAQEYIICK